MFHISVFLGGEQFRIVWWKLKRVRLFRVFPLVTWKKRKRIKTSLQFCMYSVFDKIEAVKMQKKVVKKWPYAVIYLVFN